MQQEKISPKDVFLHLLSIIALYISAGSLISLLFDYINIFFPDPLNYYSYSSIAGSIRWSMASLIIVFPVYLLVAWMLDRDYRKFPEKKDLRIRKWLVYFTLFLAAVIIIGDLVTLVYNFLGGDLTMRFLLKIKTILIVVGAIFAYYLLDLRQQLTSRMKHWFVWVTAVAVLLSVIGGFFTAGSPLKARLWRFDERRLNDLQILQNEIINYWLQKNKLPSNLSELKNDITGFTPPADPETGLAYVYKIADPLNFELCANFNFSSQEVLSGPKAVPYYEGFYQQNWDHGKGENCFSRKIDPELYQDPRKPKF